jgi:hypothetical protein
MFTDSTYFVNDIQVTGSDIGYITAAAPKYERELLRKCLGYTLAELVLSYSISSEQRIKDIVEGKSYTDTINGEETTMYWEGLANDDKNSPLAYYVYARFMDNDNRHKSGVGMSAPEAENSKMVDSSFQIMAAWNTARELMGYYGQSKTVPSLYNFLMTCEDAETYPESAFNELNFLNPFFI